MNWSKSQKQAIKSTGGTLLLSAAAGSGKTAVVVERIINKIINPKNNTNIDELLIVTFSNAAATEIKERISKKIHELLLENPEDLHIQKQQILLDTANISTIHSFCQNIIKQNFENLSIYADFKICNEYQSELLKHQAFFDIIDDFYKIPEINNILKITDATYSPEKLFKIIINIFDFLRALPFYLDWLEQNLLEYKNLASESNFLKSKFLKIIFKNAYELLIQAKNIIITCQEISIGFENYLNYQDNFNQKLDFINNLLDNIKNNNFEKIYEILNSFDITALPRAKKNDDYELKQTLKNLHDEFKIIINNLKLNYFFINQKELVCDIKYIIPNFELLINIIKKFDLKYTELKKQKNYLDFSDLEQLAIKLLLKKNKDKYIKTQVAQNISENFKEIFVDEYQDTNLIQEYIFEAISKNQSNLFLVGDSKQSIYRFRQARPELFIKKNNSYTEYDNKNFPAKIILNQNFRSNKSVTDFINFIFSQLMSSEAGEIDYDNNQKLIPVLKRPENLNSQTEIYFIKNNQKNSSEERLFNEAYYIATKIKELVNNKFKINKNNILSEVSYGDFCILMRSPNEKTKYFIKAFNELGVPLVTEQNNNLFESTEIITLISFLKIINNPLDDISLSSVMLSEIFEFTSDDILILKNYNLPNLFLAIKEDIKKTDSKYNHLYNFIILFKNFSNFLSLDKLLEKIYLETDFYNIVRINKNGSLRQNNLDLFKELAKDFSESGNNNLIEFIYYLNKLKEQKLSLITNNNDNLNDIDCVKIMSIHKSKGLEFPIVILADTNRQINKIDIKLPILFHHDLGFGFNKFDLKQNIKYTTLPKNAIKLELEKNTLSEELRILYVALTRAREKLLIMIFDNNYQKRFDYWSNLLSVSLRDNKFNKVLPAYLIKQAKNYEDFFILALLRHPEIKQIISNNIISLTDEIPKISIYQIEYNKQDLLYNNPIANNIIIKPDQNIINIIKKRADFNYSFKNLTNVPSKLGVSDIAKKDLALKFSFEKRPKLFYKNNLTSAERGNILHKFMQFCDYKQAKINLDLECRRLLAQEFISQEEYENLDKNRLKKFFNSELYNIISSADKVYREHRFVYPISTSQLSYLDFQDTNHDNIIVQGIADCVIENKDEIIIIDYKTDKINYIEELYQKYSDQILIYQEALSEIFHKKSNKSILYSFYLNKYYIIKN